jgi:hypothetical protein
VRGITATVGSVLWQEEKVNTAAVITDSELIQILSHSELGLLRIKFVLIDTPEPRGPRHLHFACLIGI